MTRYYSILLVIVSVGVLFSSCVKSELKVPTTSQIIFDINRDASPTGHLQFHYGEIRLGELIMDGERVQGDDIYYLREYESGVSVNLDGTQELADFKLAMPQGQYSKMEVEFSTYSDQSQPVIVLEGTYINTMSQPIPVRYEFVDTENWSVVLQENASGNSIVLDKEKNSQIVVKFDPIYWFSIVPTTLFENATLTNIQGVNTLLITESINHPIYNMVATRVDDAVTGKIHTE